MIRGITFADQIITSADDAHFRDVFLNKAVGISKGCEISNDATNIYIQAGYFVVRGRFVNIVGTETVTPEPIEAGSMYCRLVFEIDLTKANTTEEFNQGAFKVLKSLNSYPTTTTEDLENGGNIYQLSFAKFILTPTGMSNFAVEITSFDMSKVWENVTKTQGQYDAEFKVYYDKKKAIIEKMIKDLENDGFVTTDTMNTLLSKKADKTDVDTKLKGKADSNHYHDDRYYTETEVNNLLNGKANSTHTHSASQVSGLPTSLPANGGNSDTVDGYHIAVVGSLPSSQAPNTIYFVTS